MIVNYTIGNYLYSYIIIIPTGSINDKIHHLLTFDETDSLDTLQDLNFFKFGD